MKVSKLSRNFLFLAGSNFTVQFIRFVMIVVAARRLGSESFGVYNYLILLVTYGAIGVEFGLKNVAIRELSQGRGSRGLVGKILKIRAALAGIAIIAVMLLAHSAFPNGEFLYPSLIIGASLFANAFLMDFLVIVEEKFVTQAVANIAQAGFCLLGVLAFVHDPSHFERLAWVFFGGQLLWTAILWFASQPWKNPRLERPDTEAGISVWATALQGLPFLVALLFFTVQSTMDLLLLGQFQQRSILGDYSSAMKIISIPQGLIAAFAMAMQPRIAREAGDFASPKLHQLLHQTSRMLWIALVPTVLGCWFFGETLTQWIFGKQFPLAAQFLRPLSLSFLFSCLALAPIQALTTSKKTKMLMKLVFGNATFTFLSLFSVLYFEKIMFVPWVMVVAQFALMLSAWSCFPEKTYLVREDVRNLALPAVLMSLPLAAGSFGYLPPALVFGLSALGYGVGLFMMKIWRRPWMDRSDL